MRKFWYYIILICWARELIKQVILSSFHCICITTNYFMWFLYLISSIQNFSCCFMTIILAE